MTYSNVSKMNPLFNGRLRWRNEIAGPNAVVVAWVTPTLACPFQQTFAIYLD